MKIKIPVEFKEIELSELSVKDMNSLFALSGEMLKLQQYIIEKTITPSELIKILSVNIQRDADKE